VSLIVGGFFAVGVLLEGPPLRGQINRDRLLPVLTQHVPLYLSRERILRFTMWFNPRRGIGRAPTSSVRSVIPTASDPQLQNRRAASSSYCRVDKRRVMYGICCRQNRTPEHDKDQAPPRETSIALKRAEAYGTIYRQIREVEGVFEARKRSIR
jgi:hypothetical protein